MFAILRVRQLMPLLLASLYLLQSLKSTNGLLVPGRLIGLSCLSFQNQQLRLSSSSSLWSSSSSDDVEDGSNENKRSGDDNDNPTSDLSWLQNAMDAPSPLASDGVVFVESQQGISGFAVDPQRGFVVVLVGGDRATYAVVSPKDKQRVRSAEALCLVQLAGGLDLGTPVLPPEILAKLVAEELENDDSSKQVDARELRRKVKLRRVNVVPYEGGEKAEDSSSWKYPTPPASTPERDAAMKEQVDKVAAAVQKLPGLEECTTDQVLEALRVHSNDEGGLDREGFSALLDTLRRQINAVETPKVQFNLLVDVVNDDDNNKKELQILAPSPIVGVGLALRYQVDVVVAEECQIEGFDLEEIASRFPAFRPLKELEEDAKIMDGFIPTMFGKATAPENDDKL